MITRLVLLQCLFFFMGLFGVKGQTTSQMVGFLKLHLQTGPNFIGFALLPTMEVQSPFHVSPGDRKQIWLQAIGVSLADGQFSGGLLPTHCIEIISSGSSQGFTSVIVATQAAGNSLTLAQEVPSSVPDGAILRVWKLWCLADVFGASNTAGLTSAETPAQADLILLPDPAGVVKKYFYSSGGAQGIGWRLAEGGNASQANVPVLLTHGMAILAKSAKTVLLVGQVKQGSTQLMLRSGHNYVANLCPVNYSGTGSSVQGRTLANSGLATGLTGGTASDLADLVLLWNGTGYDQFYYSTGGLAGAGWRKIGAGTQNQDNMALPDGAYVILRRGPPITLTLNQGDF
jgi:uncharacterized protein (TIGR02597 family)